MKKCKKCGNIKYHCRGLCKHCYNNLYYRKNKRQILKQSHEFYRKNKEHYRKQKREYNQKNKEKIRKDSHEYYNKNSEYIKFQKKNYYKKNKKRILNQHKQWYKKNRLHVLNQKLEYFNKNKKTIYDWTKKWKKSKKGKKILRIVYKKYNHSKKGRERTLKNNFKRREKLPIVTMPLSEIILKRDGFICQYCKKRVIRCKLIRPNQLTYDHIDSDGGTTLNNLVVSCRECNISKQTKNVFEWCKEKETEVPKIILKLTNNNKNYQDCSLEIGFVRKV
jgi:hypothetical protein